MIENPKTLYNPERRSFLKYCLFAGGAISGGLMLNSVFASLGLEEAIAKSTPSTKNYVPAAKTSGSSKKIEEDLQSIVNNYIQSQRKIGQMTMNESIGIKADERTSWYVYDITADKNLVNLHGDEMYQAASMIKPLVALAYFHQVKNGRLRYDAKAKKELVKMIKSSNNHSTNWFINQIGSPAKVQNILKDSYGHLFKNLSITSKIPAGGREYNNKVSAHDYSRFLYAMIHDQIPGAKEIRYAMGLENGSRIYTTRDTILFDKTGTTGKLCGNMGIVFVEKDNKYYPYIFIGIIEKKNKADSYMPWKKSRAKIIKNVSKMVYEHLNRKYGFGG